MVVAGIFVGGRASRMGGVAKGLLIAPDGQPILVRTRRLLEEVGVAECVLVGKPSSAYEPKDENDERLQGLRVLEDDPSVEGPLAGLLALLAYAQARGANAAIAVACDMPLLTHDLLERLMDASASAPIVAPRHGEFWEPLIARYNVPSSLLIARTFTGRKLQHLLDVAGAHPLELTQAEQASLVDWDAPEDVTRTRV